MQSPRPLALARAVYFCYYAAWASLLPFLPLYYQSLGFAASRIGVLTSISPLVTLFGAPFWGGLADASHQHRRVLLGTLAAAGLAVAAVSQVRPFWALVPLIATYAFFAAPVIPLVDTSVLALLGKRRDRYGHQRLWGAVGWGVAALVVGWLAERYGLLWSFIVYLLLVAATWITASRMPIHVGRIAGSYWSGARRLLADRRWLLFLGAVFLAGVGHAAITYYLFLTMGELGASRTVMGFALTVATVSEIPVLFYSGWLVRHWGPRGVLALSLAAYVVRALCLSAAVAPWQVLLTQLLHGLTFSALWVAGVTLAGEIAPEGLGATAQGLFSSTVMGVGAMVGALVNGVLFERLGGARMFGWNAALVGLGLVLFAASSLLQRRGERTGQV